jgi:hypothetical protein
MQVPEPTRSTVAEIYRWREAGADDGHRPHLGASLIGHSCDRFLWLTFRWARRERFDGRVLRLFDRGKREEAVVIEELRGIGCEVWADDGGEQFRVSALGGHFGGSMDAVAEGLPEAPRTAHVVEIKTHGAKSFKDLQAKGVVKAKPMHHAQMQAYMHLAHLKRAAYFAVNKDTDEIHFERLEHDTSDAEALLERAERIITARVPPARLNDDPAWFECKWCPMHALCHGTAAPEVNCRTCAHATPLTQGDDARWLCEHPEREGGISVSVQREGCHKHRVIPILLERFAEPIDATDDTVTYRNKATGAEFVNGEGAGCVTSREIHALSDKRVLGQERDLAGFHAELSREFGEVEYVG